MERRKLESKIIAPSILKSHASFTFPEPTVIPLPTTPGKHPRKLVTSNGGFDILHPGHCKCLERARSYGDLLLVLVNTDSSVRRYKGDLQPYNVIVNRMACIAALESVDFVSWFSEDTPFEVLSRLYLAGYGPHIHVKGGDYTEEQMPEAKIVRKYGGEVRFVGFEYETSTSQLVSTIISRNLPGFDV